MPDVVAYLDAHGGCTIRQLASAFKMPETSMARVVDGLVVDGVVVRRALVPKVPPKGVELPEVWWRIVDHGDMSASDVSASVREGLIRKGLLYPVGLTWSVKGRDEAVDLAWDVAKALAAPHAP